MTKTKFRKPRDYKTRLIATFKIEGEEAIHVSETEGGNKRSREELLKEDLYNNRLPENYTNLEIKIEHIWDRY